MSVVIKYGSQPSGPKKQEEPYWSLVFGRMLFLAEVSLALMWFVYGQKQIRHHDIAASVEPLLGAQHFLVFLSIVSLFGELSKVCKDGKCSRMHTHYAWLVPPILALPFDILTMQRQMVFYHSDALFRGIAIFALVLSSTTSIWTFLVIQELKRYPKKSYLNDN